ncbi:GAF domain-containing protein [Consotaella salsifontis]|uniref:GAF domain-containing protein n=1 Tax=Consotaella salsifontis TaxID=1365950 RepID=A0A1T4SFE7_9HYPH|nr:GAF domain-containing protein [Consotaella salsifontis]SKA26893.1 GAF domain-containing protein [Consotaella salsifontis]
MLDPHQLMKRQQVLVDFGEFAIRSDDLDEVLMEACRLVGDALGTGRAKVLEIQNERQELFVRAGVGWGPDVVGQVRLPMGERSSETYSIRVGKPVISQDIATETRFGVPRFMRDAGVVALINVPIFVPGERPYGILQVDDTEPREFGEDEIQFLRTYATILGPVIDRLHLVEERRATQEQLTADLAAMEELQRVSAELVGEQEPQALYQRMVEAACALMQSDASSLQELDAATGELKLLAWRGFHEESARFWQKVTPSMGTSCAQALDAGGHVIVSDVETPDARDDVIQAFRRSGLRSVQSTPLKASSGHFIGMLSTHWRDRHAPSERECRFFDLLARLTADLIERVNANKQLQESEERQSFLLKLSDALRLIADPEAIQREAARVLAEALGTNRAFFAQIGRDQDTARILVTYAGGISVALAPIPWATLRRIGCRNGGPAERQEPPTCWPILASTRSAGKPTPRFRRARPSAFRWSRRAG